MREPPLGDGPITAPTGNDPEPGLAGIFVAFGFLLDFVTSVIPEAWRELVALSHEHL